VKLMIMKEGKSSEEVNVQQENLVGFEKFHNEKFGVMDVMKF